LWSLNYTEKALGTLARNSNLIPKLYRGESI